MLAGDILKSKGVEVISIGPDDSLDMAITTLAERNIGAVLVIKDDQIEGILSERDIVRVLAGAPAGFRETPVREVMTRDVIIVEPEASVDELLDLMTGKRIRHLPVCQGTQIQGFLSIGDVVKHRIKEAVGEAEALKSYITSG